MPGITLDRLKSSVCSLKNLLGEHGVRFAPLLSTLDLERFECEHTVRLPEDYRFFLTLVGNGGQNGPCMEGLLPLGVFPETPDPSSLLNSLPDLFPFTEPYFGSGQPQYSDDEDTDFSDMMSYDSRQDMTINPTDDVTFNSTSSTNEYSGSDGDDGDNDNDNDNGDNDEDDGGDDKHAISFRELESNLKNNNTVVGGYLVLGSIAQDRHYVWILICGGACRGEIWIMHTHGLYYPTSDRMKFYQWMEDWITGGDKIRASLWDCGLYNPQLTRCFRSGVDDEDSDDTSSDQEEDYDDDSNSDSEYSYDD